MKRIISMSLALAVLAGCGKKDADDSAAKSSDSAAQVKTGPNGAPVVTLDDATQKQIGLAVEALAASQLAPEVRGYGRVMDPSALASAAGDFTSAKAANDASQAELRRLETLAAQTNASDRAVQAAAAAAARDASQFDAARLKLLATWGEGISSRADLPSLVESLGKLESALVRVDLPANEILKAAPSGARIVTLDQTSVHADYLGEVPSVDPQTQSQSFLFLVQQNAGKLAPGAAVTGYLQTAGSPISGVIVPRDAVIRHEGAAWVYVQANGTNFIRHLISADQPVERGWFVTNGVTAGDGVVVTGAATVFSQELSASGFTAGERD